jgi:hypothetical protein
MTEQPEPRRPDEAERPPVPKDTAHHEAVRTAGETAVDDALGQGDPPGR